MRTTRCVWQNRGVIMAARCRRHMATILQQGSQVERGVSGERGCESRSLYPFQHPPRLTQQRSNLPSLGDRLPGEQPMLARVPVCSRRAGALRAAVHAAALFAVHRRRAARIARTVFGAAPQARLHRTRISDVIAHASAAGPSSAELRLRLAPAAFGFLRAADAGLLSDTITRACWVTLPTMALPPPATETFCTVMAGPLWLR